MLLGLSVGFLTAHHEPSLLLLLFVLQFSGGVGRKIGLHCNPGPLRNEFADLIIIIIYPQEMSSENDTLNSNTSNLDEADMEDKLSSSEAQLGDVDEFDEVH